MMNTNAMNFQNFNPNHIWRWGFHDGPFDSHKRLRIEQDIAILHQLNPTSKYNGVTLINEKWGAQIYKEHQVWLRTFRSELDAAMTYDSASIMFHNNDRNIHSTVDDINQEKVFQKKYSEHDILEMIRSGSYPSKFAIFQSEYQKQRLNSNLVVIHDGEYSARQLLFRKVLTNSDVGRLSRLAIPKKYAVLHFPTIDSSVDARIEDCVAYIDMYDTQKNLWTFRYCYRKSNRSYVFTTGWNKFVREKGLKTDYIVSFYMNNSPEGKFYGIEAHDVGGKNIVGTVTQNINTSKEIKDYEVVRVKGEDELSAASSKVKEKDFMLFGFHIKSTPLLPQGERSIDVDCRVGENEHYYSNQTTNYQKVKIKREFEEDLKLDLKLSL